jgi:hypothetical protein
MVIGGIVGKREIRKRDKNEKPKKRSKLENKILIPEFFSYFICSPLCIYVIFCSFLSFFIVLFAPQFCFLSFFLLPLELFVIFLASPGPG